MYLKLCVLCAIIIFSIPFSSCKKKDNEDPVPSNSQATSNLRSARLGSFYDFYTSNSAPLQSFTVNAAAGGRFVLPNGTRVVVPANCFLNMLDKPILGSVTLQFKEVYSKCDMLLNQVFSTVQDGSNFKSAGVFYINVLNNGMPVKFVSGKSILVKQPFKGFPVDPSMMAMAYRDSTTKDGIKLLPNRWLNSLFNKLDVGVSYYNHKVLALEGVPGFGMWCNTGTPTYFTSLTNTTLTINESVATGMDVFVVYDDVKTVVKVEKVGTSYVYPKASLGQKCTVVALSIDNNNVSASFMPLTISANLIVDPVLVPTTEAALLAQLKTLN